MTLKRKTLRSDCVFSGDGLHSGVPVEVKVGPGEEGILFCLGPTRVRATPENVTDTSRSTRLGDIGTIEHLMSALAALEITDAVVELSAPELPALDGSAREYLHGLSAAGIQEVADVEALAPFSRVFVQDGHSKVAISAGSGCWRYEFRGENRWPEEMVFECEDVVACYAAEIAPARTFAFEEEVEPLLAAGLGRGLGETSALILGPSGFANESRFEDEPARHKLLDVIGDLYLSGVPIKLLNVVAERSGHRHNVKAAQMLREAALAQGG